MRLVVLVPPAGDAEGAAAVHWARDNGHDVERVALGVGKPPVLPPGTVVWCHAGQPVPTLDEPWRRALAGWVGQGGALLLSLMATVLASDAGASGERPLVEPPAPWRNADDPLWDADFRAWPDFPHIRGAQGWGEHPLFDGLQRGAFTWTASEGESVGRTVFRVPRWPAGRVLAVDRAYVRLDADTAVAWEYDVGMGRILCLGANVVLRAADRRLAPQRDRYLANALAYLDPRRELGRVRRTAWPPRPVTGRVALQRARAMARDPLILRPPALATVAGDVPVGPLVLEGAARPDAPFTIAGRRVLVTGDEQGGVRECWLHPLCVFSEGIQLTASGEVLRATTVRVTPGMVERRLADAGGGAWREIVAPAPDDALFRYEITPLDRALNGSLFLGLSLRPRLQWPIPVDALHPLVTDETVDGPRVALAVRGSDGRTQLHLAIDGADGVEVHAAPHEVRLSIRSSRGVRLAVIAHADGTRVPDGAWHALSHVGAVETLRRLAVRDEAREQATVRLASPVPDFDAAWRWAKARLAAFVIDVPAVGTGMAAGYATTRSGWGDARPGYAWFFGRDACWSADALLAAGMFTEARQTLEFLAATADVTGQVAHEVTTSGVAHYDAADATPLWLRLVARYAEWTGDLATVRAHWDQVRAAFACVLSQDSDGDGLPENRGVGHGWVESGPLGGGVTTSYVAAIWIDAVRRLAPLAAEMGDGALHERVVAAEARAVTAFERRLRDPATGRIALHLGADGAQASDLTALSAVPILLGTDTHPSADDVVAALAGSDFSAPWGVRMLGRRDARYRPRGYHCGAVWPLYTGWASLAAFARRRPDDGWRLLAMVGACASARARGAFDEVLDGDTGAAAGVCPDQAWSAAMAISPLIYGMLGMQPSATAQRCRLEPCWPAAWPEARLDGLRVGQSRFSLTMRREGTGAGSWTWRHELQLTAGPPLVVTVGRGAAASVVALSAGRPDAVAYTRATRGADGRR